MRHTFAMSVAVLATWLGLAPNSEAQVFIRAPFVRVSVGNGVYVRAPFVNVYVPSGDPVYGPRVFYPPPVVVQMPPAQDSFPRAPQPLPIIKDENAPPQPVQAVPAQTLEAFSKSFQAKPGSYEVTLMNPVTKQPTEVRFTLPEGTPRRVHVNRDSIEFVYSLRQWVRIEFDRDGALVTSR